MLTSSASKLGYLSLQTVLTYQLVGLELEQQSETQTLSGVKMSNLDNILVQDYLLKKKKKKLQLLMTVTAPNYSRADSTPPRPFPQIPLGDMCVGGGACKTLRRTNFPCAGMWPLVSGSLTFNSWCVWLVGSAGAVALLYGSAGFTFVWRSDWCRHGSYSATFPFFDATSYFLISCKTEVSKGFFLMKKC